jgi:hypothetical protein
VECRGRANCPGPAVASPGLAKKMPAMLSGGRLSFQSADTGNVTAEALRFHGLVRTKIAPGELFSGPWPCRSIWFLRSAPWLWLAPFFCYSNEDRQPLSLEPQCLTTLCDTFGIGGARAAVGLFGVAAWFLAFALLTRTVWANSQSRSFKPLPRRLPFAVRKKNPTKPAQKNAAPRLGSEGAAF